MPHEVETSSHWGTYLVDIDDNGHVIGTRPHTDDPDSAPAIANVSGAQHARARVARPTLRRRWLENGPGPDDHRGSPDDEYVEVDWPTALDLLADELDRVRATFGNEAIFGGSYGWASAGRFHHAQSQLHRFLNRIGGYTRSVNDYSRGTSMVMQPYVVGKQGDLALRARRAGATTRIVSLSAQRDDALADVGAEWIGVMPGTDTAVMLSLIHTHGFGSMGDFGVGFERVPVPFFPQGTNPVAGFIPCARISDMLLHPGEEFPYDGSTLRYPDVKLASWAGGNPFHHHQDLRRLTRALGRLDTFVVDEMHWTPTAKHADIVLPVATTLERDDIAAGVGDARLRVSRRAVAPYAEAREEFAIFTELARRLKADFDEGLSAADWLRKIYEDWRATDVSPPAPPFDEFWEVGGVPLRQRPYDDPVFSDFRVDPDLHPLQTPSGRIELYSATIASYGLRDVPGHAAWIEPTQWWRSPQATTYDLHLLCNQPSHRLHSQQDMGAASRSTKVGGREPIRLHPADAAVRGLRDGDVARVRSAQGTLLAGVVVTGAMSPGVAQMHTGAWCDPI